jgi:hypothetical protein
MNIDTRDLEKIDYTDNSFNRYIKTWSKKRKFKTYTKNNQKKRRINYIEKAIANFHL